MKKNKVAAYTKKYTSLGIKYPKLFDDKCKIFVQDGWYPIIKSMCRQLDTINGQYKNPIITIQSIYHTYAGWINIAYNFETTTKDINRWREVIDSVIFYNCDKTSRICERCGGEWAQSININEEKLKLYEFAPYTQCNRILCKDCHFTFKL